jgi:catechol 2,3-dioxygenase-like lactoylglutathione lyase family enzyme
MIKSIQHVNISVSNLDAAIYFFCDLLGLEMLVPVEETAAE